MHRSRVRGGPAGGFTLIELLVAITVLAVLAVVSWRGLDQISRATAQNRVRADAVLTVQTALSQWSVDLDAIAELEAIVPIDWDGRVLRLTRNGSDAARPALVVVAWTLSADSTGPRWHRWQSLPLTTRPQWQQAWAQAAAWAAGLADAGCGAGPAAPHKPSRKYPTCQASTGIRAVSLA
ncbi:MAG: prepilin-type N-terminal cleavage/methylation domain-containing protein, partial [Comamonadaceae bacterium]